MNMRERIEKAAREAVFQTWGHILVNGESAIVAAVLDAMRETTAEMMDEGEWANDACCINENGDIELSSEVIWQAMIDAAKNGA